jgi:serine protease Do
MLRLMRKHGIQNGDIIFDVGGKAVANAGEVRSALTQASADGKHSVLLQVKTADAIRFVALPLAKG